MEDVTGEGSGGLSPREQVAAGLSGALTPEMLAKLLDEVLAIEKPGVGNCKCGKRVTVMVPDARAVTGSLADLLREGFGTPASQSQEREIIVNREVVLVYECESGLPCGCGACSSSEAAEAAA